MNILTQNPCNLKICSSALNWQSKKYFLKKKKITFSTWIYLLTAWWHQCPSSRVSITVSLCTFQKMDRWMILAGDTYLYVNTYVLFFFFLIWLFYLRKTKFELCFKSWEATRKKKQLTLRMHFSSILTQ